MSDNKTRPLTPAFLSPVAVDRFLKNIERDRAVERGYAEVTYERLVEEIRSFEASLAVDEETGANLASFGSTRLIRITDLDFANPYLITFYGELIPGGGRAQLCQHVSQVNVLLTAIKVPTPGQPARRIGFGSHAEHRDDS